MIKLVNIYILCNIYFYENVRKNCNIEGSKCNLLVIEELIEFINKINSKKK